MFRNKIFYAFLPLASSTSDVVKKDTTTVLNTDIKEVKEETGIDRLKRMFYVDEFSNISPELNIVLNVSFMSMFIGALYGGIMHSKTAYLDFIEKNQATVFKDHLEAKKRLQDKVTLTFGKGAFKWSWRLCLFSTTYVGITTALSTYRGKNGVIEHVLAGGLTGMLYKFPTGPRAALVGGGLGLALGTIGGLVTVGLLNLSGMSMEEVRYWNYKWKESRMNVENKTMKKYMEKEQMEILKLHNEKLGEAGNNLDSIDI